MLREMRKYCKTDASFGRTQPQASAEVDLCMQIEAGCSRPAVDGAGAMGRVVSEAGVPGHALLVGDDNLLQYHQRGTFSGLPSFPPELPPPR